MTADGWNGTLDGGGFYIGRLDDTGAAYAISIYSVV